MTSLRLRDSEISMSAVHIEVSTEYYIQLHEIKMVAWTPHTAGQMDLQLSLAHGVRDNRFLRAMGGISIHKASYHSTLIG